MTHNEAASLIKRFIERLSCLAPWVLVPGGLSQPASVSLEVQMAVQLPWDEHFSEIVVPAWLAYLISEANLTDAVNAQDANVIKRAGYDALSAVLI